MPVVEQPGGSALSEPSATPDSSQKLGGTDGKPCDAEQVEGVLPDVTVAQKPVAEGQKSALLSVAVGGDGAAAAAVGNNSFQTAATVEELAVFAGQ